LQTPETQLFPLGHAVAQAPQWFASFCSFTQAPEQEF
jgi:hypothetical protein